MHTSPERLHEAAVACLAQIEGKALMPKERMAIPAQEMPSQDPSVRRGNMGEVALGYSAEQARVEAMRCLQCKNAPCVAGCPVKIRIPDFLKAAAEGRFDDALAIIREDSLLPAVCGRVCPQESQCQAPCTLGKALKDPSQAVSIGRVERFVADREMESGNGSRGRSPSILPPTGKRVAVIGSGPAGITVAADVRREGHEVVLFEAFHKPGGVLVYGIPEFRLPKAIVRQEVDALAVMGVRLETNFVVGRTRTITALMAEDGFDAVFIGTGAGLPKFMGIPGENLVGVFSANEYLTRSNLMKAYDAHAHTPMYASKKVAVLGGGNVAMDAARTALRLGAEEVHLVYRRTLAEMPARAEEVAHAQEEGVQFHLLQNAVRILGDADDRVRQIECLRYELGEPDASGRRRPVEVPGSEFLMDVDTVIVAIGNGSNPLISQTTEGLAVSKRGNIIVDENGKTSVDGIYAGGDIVLGAATVILAMGEGRRAAAAINRWLA
ncbi:MAG: NADPH-dependent glutamate synthase [Kiritimatiellaeota bacterium]|nr:NADPH-dependent glutamate synthase [Kiritimatiellota bacterium]